GALALVEAWSGNLNDGEALAVRALSLADELDHDSPTRTTAWLALAFVARRRDDLARAETLLDTVEETGGTRRRVVGLCVATERHTRTATLDCRPRQPRRPRGAGVRRHGRRRRRSRSRGRHRAVPDGRERRARSRPRPVPLRTHGLPSCACRAALRCRAPQT